MPIITQTYTPANGVTSDGTGMQADLSALFGAINGGLDFANVGAGFYASQIIGDTTAHATFTTVAGWTMNSTHVTNPGLTVQATSATATPLMVIAAAANSSDAFQVWNNRASGGSPDFNVDSSGVSHFLRGIAVGAIAGYTGGAVAASAVFASAAAAAVPAFVYNATGGTTGDLARFQLGGVTKFTVNNAGGVITQLGTSGGGFKTAGAADVYSGSGVPSFSAPSGSLYARFDGLANNRLYVNTSTASTSGTSWAAVTTP